MPQPFNVTMMVIYAIMAFIFSSILGYCAMVSTVAGMRRAWQVVVKRSLKPPKPTEYNFGLTPVNLIFLVPAWLYGTYILVLYRNDEMIFFSLIHAVIFKVFSVSLWLFVASFIVSGIYFAIQQFTDSSS
ncbi:MAG: hypothetical protein ACI8P9_005805 [Parasphingorhabdus sp.]|jgi:hypothetical protein